MSFAVPSELDTVVRFSDWKRETPPGQLAWISATVQHGDDAYKPVCVFTQVIHFDPTASTDAQIIQQVIDTAVRRVLEGHLAAVLS